METLNINVAELAAQEQETVGEIVRRDFRKAQIFKKLGIDFCCGGKKTLQEVCDQKGLAVKEIEEQFAALNGTSGYVHNFDKWDLNFLADYIINTHHNYVKENLQFIEELAVKVASVHGNVHAELIDIADIFKQLAKDLSLHLRKEESILFPYVKKMVNIQKEGGILENPPFGTVDNPTQMMETEHEQAGDDMKAIRLLTNNYQLPEGACNSYQVLYKKLEEFENDLFNHVHLENNILFPKAIQLEKKLV